MARLASPATRGTSFDNPVLRISISRIPRPVPIQSASPHTSSNAAPAARRHVPIKSVSKTRSKTMPVIFRSQLAITSRTKLAMPPAKQTRIPGPTTSAIQKARSKIQIQIRMPTMIVRRKNIIAAKPSSPVPTSKTLPSVEKSAQLEGFPSGKETISWDDVSEADNSSIADDDTSLLFNDNSFDDSIDPNQQTPGLSLMERTLAACKRLDNGRRIARAPWFVGLAQCPGYIGDILHQPRVRPSRKEQPRVVRPCQHHPYYNAPNAPATSRLPHLVWPLVSIGPAETSSSGPSKPASLQPALKTCCRQPGVKPHAKHVRFAQGPPASILYDGDAPATGPALDPSDGWSPLKVYSTYSAGCQAKGKTMFKPSSSGCLTLKPPVLLRFKSVQLYEQRRKEDAVATGKQPDLGQLEYGNADYKIALQATDVITAYDIGTLQNLSTIGKMVAPPSTYQLVCGPLLVFGAFKEPFADAAVPSQTAMAYKRPFGWPDLDSERSWRRFEKEQFRSLPQADLED